MMDDKAWGILMGEAVCRGSLHLGSGCKKCPKCLDEIDRLVEGYRRAVAAVGEIRDVVAAARGKPERERLAVSWVLDVLKEYDGEGD